ncbi:D-alanine transaminase [Alkalibacterium subtropicum]|uniref:D-alanine aminotransferase n=1 Tax=Alkalibacterium subtropicum TaxID=753702 RepID=A0A1I1EAA6_9LACT|nr:D-amino-acid transaminase [Alkalibacterium subtropicum]SFB83512.1 D-alanine transaminase [Alkalibacterium subtropicum]
MKVIWGNEIVDRNKVTIDFEDRGYQFGDGVYEVISFYNRTYFCMEEHIDRFFSSAKKIEMRMPLSKSELKELITDLLNESEATDGYIYIQMTRGNASPRDHSYPSQDVVPLLTGSIAAAERDTDKLKKGIKTTLEEDIRWLRCDIKMISLLGNIMLKHEAHKKNADEAILHRGNIVTECSSSNVAMVKDGAIYTHPDGNLILPGITKIVWKACAEQLNIPVYERPFTTEELLEADEVFCSSTTKEVMPVNQIDDKVFELPESGSLIRLLQSCYEKKVVEQCGDLTN